MLDIPVPVWPRTVKAVLKLPSVTYADRRLLPQVTGIYFAIVDRSSVAYIGCTSNLRQRWTAHHHRDRLHAMGEVSIGYVTCEYGPVLWGAESAAIHQFWPPLNMETRYRFRYGKPPKPRWPTQRAVERWKSKDPAAFTKWDWVNEGILKPTIEWQREHYPEIFDKPTPPPGQG